MERVGGGSSRAMWLQAAVLGSLVVALVAGVLLLDGPSAPEQDIAAEAPEPAPAPPTPIVDAADAAERTSSLYGWGSVQPYKMRATVEWGATNEPVTPEQHVELGVMLDKVRDVAMSIGTVAEAERLGYVKNYQRISGRGYEYIKWSNFKSELDLDNPTLLAFPDDSPDSRVMSVAYNVLGSREAGPPDDFPLDLIGWHYHQNLCEVDGTVVGSIEFDAEGNPYPDMQKRCDDLGASPMPWLDHWMVDLWVLPGWENPWGLISSKHPDLMDEPTPWFGPQFASDADGFGLYCKLPESMTSPTGPTPS